MQRSRSLGLGIGAVLAICFLISPVLAGSDNAGGVGKIPRLAGGRPDFSGIWQTTSAADQGLEPGGHRAVVAGPGQPVAAGDRAPRGAASRDRAAARVDLRDEDEWKLLGEYVRLIEDKITPKKDAAE